MLYSDRRYDISDQILRNISRANNRKKLDSRKDKRKAENEEIIDEAVASKNVINNIEEKEENNSQVSDPKRKLTVKELLEQRKQKNSNKRKVKD
jgi:hypothetical protein